ncbi:hypothetical protein [Dorea formicigenerans]|uniref:hypothetical protein n=1 Tax=Dorea formicigenerans TaxID=39486 RepID=UPI00356997D8
MKIEFGVQEYFNELKLMDAQYGQEEELYPWVYMLLQMAESRKKEILKECYQGVSIRDVHNGVKKKDNELIKLLHQKNGFPDHVILERKYGEYKILGCSEIKKNEEKNKKFNLMEKQYKVNDFLTPIKYNVEFFFNTVKIIDNINENSDFFCNLNTENITKEEKIYKIIEGIKDNKDYVKVVDEQIEKAITKVFTSAGIEEQYIKKWEEKGALRQHPQNTRSYCVKLEIKSKQDIENAIKQKKENMQEIIEINGKTIPHLKIEITEADWSFKTELEETELPPDDVKQILSHLEKFKKVLYTNGLEFYYLVLNEKKIDVKKIADLQPMYAEYKENTTPSPQLLLEASAEWDRLIAGLTSIGWHQKPVAEIPSI